MTKSSPKFNGDFNDATIKGDSSTEIGENEELRRFREAWRAEVQRKKGDTSDITQDSSEPSTSSAVTVDISGPARRGNRALELYIRAVNCEENRDLEAAVHLYREAFRLDPDVEKAYFKEEQRKRVALGFTFNVPKPSLQSEAPPPDEVTSLTTSFKTISIQGAAGGGVVVTGTLADLVAEFPQPLAFDVEDDKEFAPFVGFPDELMVNILKNLDTNWLERFAAVSKKARMLTLDSSIWRGLVQRVYRPPQVTETDSMGPVIERCSFDYRRVYIEQPRVRTDGVYIAICHYLRPGHSENHWVNLTHLITYHRYLRFFPDGQVLSLLANEELKPKQVIPLLRSTLRMKGLSIGTWYLSNRTVYVENLVEVSTKDNDKELDIIEERELLKGYSHGVASVPGAERMRYLYQMTLDLRTKPLGRWNRLDLVAYNSLRVADGEVVPIAMKHERGFIFSKVRSYGRA